MSSSTCQISSALVPKFKLNWANLEKTSIKEKLVESLIAIQNTDGISFSSQSSSNHTNAIVTEVDDFLDFKNDQQITQNDGARTVVSDYLSNIHIKSPDDLPIILKTAYIEYNTAVPSTAHVERLLSAGGQLFSKRRGSMSDTNFEMALLLKFNKYFIQEK